MRIRPKTDKSPVLRADAAGKRDHFFFAESVLAGFFFAFLVACLFVAPWIALAGAAVGMFVEVLPLPVNDNLLIPLCTGLVLRFLV